MAKCFMTWITAQLHHTEHVHNTAICKNTTWCPRSYIPCMYAPPYDWCMWLKWIWSAENQYFTERPIHNLFDWYSFFSQNERDGISNHRRPGRLLNRLFRRRPQKTPNLRITGLCEGNPLLADEWPVDSPSKGPLTWKKNGAEPRLESFYLPFVAGIDLPHQGVADSYNPTFVAGIDLPHQGVVDSYSLVHPGVRDKHRMSEIDLSQPGHETAFWWRHNGPVTSQLTDPFKWPNYPLESIGIYVHITHKAINPWH